MYSKSVHRQDRVCVCVLHVLSHVPLGPGMCTLNPQGVSGRYEHKTLSDRCGDTWRGNFATSTI